LLSKWTESTLNILKVSDLVHSAKFLIRRATHEDLVTLVQLRLDLLHEIHDSEGDTDPITLADATHQYLSEKLSNGEFIAWVAEANGRIIGTSGLVFFKRPPTGANPSGLEAYIMNMYTLPEWRGQGIASALLREIMGFVKSTDAKCLWLRATEQGKLVYRKLGLMSSISYMELIW
jgi:GNAT superfamily N-acetyltransferase